jgi:superfamily II DNA or RNA helicase
MISPELVADLFDAIRKAAPPGEWSTGVAMARDGKVLVESEAADQIALRIVSGQKARAPEVLLFPEDEEWQCDCGSRLSVCAHIAAAVIALKQAASGESQLAKREREVARLVYRLESQGEQLAFRRMLVGGGRERPFVGEVAAFRDDDVTLVATAEDVAIEKIVLPWREGRIPNGDIPRLFQALQRVRGVVLDGDPIDVKPLPVLPRLRVQDAGRSFLVELIADPGVERRYRNGAALVAGELRPVDDEAGLEGWLRRDLQRGKAYDQGAVSQLLELLSRLDKQIPIDIRTRRLPRITDVAPPRVLIETLREGDVLRVLGRVVYGDPPCAEVVRGRLELLGDSGEYPVRDEAVERRLEARLHTALGLDAGREAAFVGLEAVSFAARLGEFERGAGRGEPSFAVSGEGHAQFQLTAPLEGSVAFGADGGIDIHFNSNGTSADPKRVLEAWRNGWNVAPLDDGQWAPLPADWMGRFGPALLGLLDAKALDAEGDAVPVAALGDVRRLADALGTPMPPRFERLRGLLGDFEGIPRRDLPDGVQAELRPYQQQGYEWLAFHREAGLGALLADDMGLGKTLQALVSAKGRTLVVAPTSVMPNWRREVARFRPDLSVNVYHGPDRALAPDVDITITTWAILRLDIDVLSSIHWDTTILDESQMMKNPESQVAQAAFRLKSSFRVALTGTPLENRLEDLWSQMRYVEPGLLNDLEVFRSRWVEPAQRGEAHVMAQLRERVRPFILRRLKREVATDLPPRTELVQRVELQSHERELYEALRAATRKEVVEALAAGGGVIKALEALLRLRQAACHPGLIPGQREVASSSKVDQLLELLETLVSEGHKVLVFSQWTAFLDRIEPHLGRAKLTHLRLDGATRDRQAVVDAFQAEGGPPVLLLSLKAGGTGLNLTAADHVVLLDPWWNPAAEDQAADRAHRIGQTKPVMVHRMVATDTVEERILALQEQKRALAKSAVGDGPAVGAALTRDDLLALLAD